MAKYLSKECVDIRIKTIQISRRFTAMPEAAGDWQTYAVLLGEAIDEDGKVLENFNRKFDVGSPGSNDWDADSFEADLMAIAALVKAKYNNVLASYTNP
jgi:hypothetical protein